MKEMKHDIEIDIDKDIEIVDVLDLENKELRNGRCRFSLTCEAIEKSLIEIRSSKRRTPIESITFQQSHTVQESLLDAMERWKRDNNKDGKRRSRRIAKSEFLSSSAVVIVSYNGKEHATTISIITALMVYYLSP